MAHSAKHGLDGQPGSFPDIRTSPAGNAKHLIVSSPAEASVSVPIPMALSALSAYDWCGEVRLDQLSALERMVITTRNHTYEVIVTSPGTGDVLVRGGTVFPRFMAAHLNGSTLGGSLIKLGSVNVGFRVEFTIEGHAPIVTTRVQTLAVIHS